MEKVINATITPPIVLSGDSIFDTSAMYIVPERSVVCDISKEDRIIDALIVLICTHYVYNLEYKIQRNAMVFLDMVILELQKTDKIPIRVTQVVNMLG